MARIGIDVRKLQDYGIGTYIQNLITGLESMDSRHNYVLFHKPGEEMDLLPAGMDRVIEKSDLYSLKELLSLGKNARRSRLDLLHCPHYVTPYRPGCRLVVTIHDIIHLLFPEYLKNNIARIYAHYFLKRAVKKAKIIFTVSETCKRDILEHLPAKEEQIRVVSNAVDSIFKATFGEEEKKRVLSRHEIDKPFILNAGNNKPHKNLGKALSAFALFRQRAGKEWKFVLAGSTFKDPESGAALLRQIEESKLADAVQFTGFLSKHDLAVIYSAADLFLFPSLYEGFGLPPLEAMASGAPVVASNRSAIPEVLGKAALLVNPEDIVQMSEAMIKIAENEKLREELILEGRRQVNKFTWERTAALTLKGYNDALEAA